MRFPSSPSSMLSRNTQGDVAVIVSRNMVRLTYRAPPILIIVCDIRCPQGIQCALFLRFAIVSFLVRSVVFGSSDWHDCQRQLDMPCYWDYADLPVISCSWYVFFADTFLIIGLLSEPKKVHALCFVRGLRSSVRPLCTQQNRADERTLSSVSILWCKASKQQGDNDSQPANCFLNSIMRI